MIKRLTSVALVCTLLSVFLVVPARAASGALPLQVSLYYNFSDGSTNTANVAKNLSVTNFDLSVAQAAGWSFRSAYFRNANNFVGTIGIYVNFYYYKSTSKTSSFLAEYTTPESRHFVVGAQFADSGTWEYHALDTFDTFIPQTDYNCSTGVSLRGKVENTQDALHSIVDIQAPNDSLSLPGFRAYESTGYQSGTHSGIYYTSVQLVNAETDAILGQMEGIATAIAEQNEILSAMYGDIMQVLNSIYSRTGDLLQAANLTNSYFEAILPLLQSIDTTGKNIYALLSQQFSLLISTIQSESDDIQATINAAIDKMIAYLDNAFSSSINPALPGQSTDISGGSSTVGDAESGYQSTATERFQAISSDFAGFDGSILSGVALGGTLFQRVWNALGDYVIIYTFPLTLSICLVVVGRLSRNASRSRGSGGDKKKDGDGS